MARNARQTSAHWFVLLHQVVGAGTEPRCARLKKFASMEFDSDFSATLNALVQAEIAQGNRCLGVSLEALGRASLCIEMALPMKSTLEALLTCLGVAAANHRADRRFHVVDPRHNYTNARSVRFPIDEQDEAQRLIPELADMNHWLSEVKGRPWQTVLAVPGHDQAIITAAEMTDTFATVLLIRRALDCGFHWHPGHRMLRPVENGCSLQLEFAEDPRAYYARHAPSYRDHILFKKD